MKTVLRLQVGNDGNVRVIRKKPLTAKVRVGRSHLFSSGDDDSISGQWQEFDVTVEPPVRKSSRRL